MKLDEMADLLDGLAAALEKLLGKTALNDLRAVSACFRQFPGETVAAFCSRISKPKDVKATSRRPAAASDGTRVAHLATTIEHYFHNRDAHDYPAIRQMVVEVNALTVPEIRALGDRIKHPLTERTKTLMVRRLEGWLMSFKLSGEQAADSRPPARAG